MDIFHTATETVLFGIKWIKQTVKCAFLCLFSLCTASKKFKFRLGNNNT